MTPALMKMPTMKKMVMLMTLILAAHKPAIATGNDVLEGTYKDSQNSISP